MKDNFSMDQGGGETGGRAQEVMPGSFTCSLLQFRFLVSNRPLQGLEGVGPLGYSITPYTKVAGSLSGQATYKNQPVSGTTK